MNYCGLDLGKTSSHFCIVDDDRSIVREGRVRTNARSLTERLGSMKPMRIVVEASTKSFWVADELEAMGHTVTVVDPGRTKAIGSALIKHDKLDARILAVLCQANLLAVVGRPTQAERLRRMPVASRDVLIRMRTIAINAARSLLDSEGIAVPSASSPRIVEVLDEVLEEVPKEIAAAVSPLVEHIEHLNASVAAFDDALAELAREDETMKLLQTAPGVGPVTAAVFLYVLRSHERFSSGRSVGAYIGLVPSLYSSGKTHRVGRITKAGNRQLRWVLTMAANALLRSSQDSGLKRWGLALAERVGRKKAKVALARKLAGVLWAMWRENRAFEPRLAA